MGTVYLADGGEGPVVLKTPSRPTADLRVRMGDEARIGFRLHHPHIVRTLDFFEDDGHPVLVIEFVDGVSLQVLRDRGGPMPPAMVARIGEQLSDALATIHHLKDDRTGEPLQILHRDVTPGNIIIDRNGDAKLIDLGIARSIESEVPTTSSGILRGTFRYLSPDLFVGKPYSWMTDLWSLAVSLLEGSLGRRTLIAGSPAHAMRDVMAGRLMDLLPGEELNPMLRFLFEGLLAVDANDRRFKDPEEVLHAFRVVRGRLGDGLDDAKATMARVLAGDVEAGDLGAAIEADVAPAVGPDDATKQMPLVAAAPPSLELDIALDVELATVETPLQALLAAVPAPVVAAPVQLGQNLAPVTAPSSPRPLAPIAAPGTAAGFRPPPVTMAPLPTLPSAENPFEVPTTQMKPASMEAAPASMEAPPSNSSPDSFEVPTTQVRPAPTLVAPPATSVDAGFKAGPITSVEEPEDRRPTLSMPMVPVEEPGDELPGATLDVDLDD